MISLVFLYFLLLMGQVGSDYDLVQKFPLGYIDWTRGILRATGIGAPNPNDPLATQRPGAIRAAKLDALRNALELIKGVNIDATTTVENFMTTSDVIKTKIQGIIQNYNIVDVRYMSDGSVEIDVEVALTGEMMSTLYPADMGNKMPIINPQIGGIFTGLVIDARGFKVQPAMAPKIVTPDGVEVYGTGYVSREYAVEMGICGYAKGFDKVKTDERVAPNPLIIKAVGVTGPNKTDVIISPNDAMKIHQYSEHLNFLQQCRVMIIVD